MELNAPIQFVNTPDRLYVSAIKDDWLLNDNIKF